MIPSLNAYPDTVTLSAFIDFRIVERINNPAGIISALSVSNPGISFLFLGVSLFNTSDVTDFNSSTENSKLFNIISDGEASGFLSASIIKPVFIIVPEEPTQTSNPSFRIFLTTGKISPSIHLLQISILSLVNL